MFSSPLNALRPAHSHPPNGHPESSDRAEIPAPSARFRPCRKESGFFQAPDTAASLRISHSITSFSTAAPLRAHSNARNPNPLMRLLHDSLDTPGGGSSPTNWPPFAPSRDSFSFGSSYIARSSDQPPTSNPFRIRTYTKRTRIPFGIRTSKTQDLKSFRMCTSKKTGEGVTRSARISALSTSRLFVAHSMLRPAP
jgi:hypothetical protein